ncbi:MAG: branched-chain amino acid transport system II carrier protein [Eubacteriales bacterium]|nr:branched-chain amino acid transport system II carrier protein [Eubacteriales bacterium]
MRSRTKDLLIIGFALFAMFLGAGNIIFPPYMGSIAGNRWGLSALGFILTGTGLPMLGVIAVAKAGGTAADISNRVSDNFALVINTVILTFIGPLFAIPRTAATTVELSIRPFMPAEIDSKTLLVVSALGFFMICLFFVLTPNQVIDRIGSILTPVLIVFLLILIITSIVKPIGRAVAPDFSRVDSGLFHLGFSTGYQTMDALASIVFGGTIAHAIFKKGYKGRQASRLMQGVALVAGLGTMLVYVGFAWIGASGSAHLQGIQDRTTLTTTAIELLAGQAGKVILALIIFLACLTTAIGLLLTAGQYFTAILKQRFSFRQVTVFLGLISYLISIMGVEGIINLSTPLLEIIYPVVIVLIVLNLFGEKIKYDEVFVFGVIFSLPLGILQALKTISVTRPQAEQILTHVPLGPQGFAFFIPAIIGCVLGWFYGRHKEAKLTKADSPQE